MVGFWPLRGKNSTKALNVVTNIEDGSLGAGVESAYDGYLFSGATGAKISVSPSSSPALDITGDEISYGGRIYPTSYSDTYQVIVGKIVWTLAHQYSVSLSYNNPNRIYVAMNAAPTIYEGGANYDISSPWALNTWNHVFVTYKNGGSFKIYLNGKVVYSQAASSAISTKTADVLIGSDPYDSWTFLGGNINDVGIFNREISEEEVFKLYSDPLHIYKNELDSIFLLPASGGGPVEHTTTGVLTGAGAEVAGSAVHNALHTTTGVLTGAGAEVAGSANRTHVHPSTGILTGAGASVAGSANRTHVHPSTGVLTGAGAEVAGSAVHNALHTTTGVLTGAGAEVAGSANRTHVHPSTGILTGAGASVAGSANRTHVHPSTGVLTGAGAEVAGSAVHNALHTTTGVLTGAGAEVAGSAARTRVHPSTGVLTGSGALVAGSAVHNALHATTGVLTGSGASIAGSAVHNALHTTTGVLTGAGAEVAGSADRQSPGFISHNTTGILTGAGASVAGSANRTHVHPSTGVLTGAGAEVAGSAVHNALHTTTGVLTGAGAEVAGSAVHNALHTTTGVLTGAGAEVAGSAVHNALHTTTGVLTGAGAEVAGSADRQSPGFISHNTTGILTGAGASVAGSANRTHVHPSTGILTGAGASVAGSAVHNALHTTTGVLTGAGASVAGSAAHIGYYSPFFDDTIQLIDSFKYISNITIVSDEAIVSDLLKINFNKIFNETLTPIENIYFSGSILEDLTPIVKNFRIERGLDFTYSFLLKNINNDLHLNSCTVLTKFATTYLYEDTSTILSVITLPNTITLSLTDIETNLLDVRRYIYSSFIVTPNNKHIKIMGGTLEVFTFS
ncbi:MAG: LamG domain-containing protein [Bacilli bacterium]|nr:LamG domain-containing protein [Bacilli bacterium]